MSIEITKLQAMDISKKYCPKCNNYSRTCLFDDREPEIRLSECLEQRNFNPLRRKYELSYENERIDYAKSIGVKFLEENRNKKNPLDCLL